MNQATPARKLEEVLHLAELCIEVLQQNEEHHAEVMTCFNCHIKPRIMLCDGGNGTEDVACPLPLIHTWPFIYSKLSVRAFPGNITPICYKGIVYVYNLVSVPDNCLSVWNTEELMRSAKGVQLARSKAGT